MLGAGILRNLGLPGVGAVLGERLAVLGYEWVRQAYLLSILLSYYPSILGSQGQAMNFVYSFTITMMATSSFKLMVI
jgi:hypothetical protein